MFHLFEQFDRILKIPLKEYWQGMFIFVLTAPYSQDASAFDPVSQLTRYVLLWIESQNTPG
jgi:hypothetical protein